MTYSRNSETLCPRRGVSRFWALAVSLALGATLTACADEPAPEAVDRPGWITTVDEGTQELNYQSSSPLTTTNAGSITGSSTAAQQLSARLYPGVHVPGPHGQFIQNSDLISTRFLPGLKPQVIYTIAENAQFSDGAPVTCSDFLLTYTAGVMTELFDSQLPLMQHIEEFECQPNSSRFVVKLAEGTGLRWRELFAPGTVLPAHAIASRAGMPLVALHNALQNRDAQALLEPAKIWSEGFDLANFDPLLQVSFGPFLIDHVTDDGAAILTRNETYYGDNAQLGSLAVWPARADTAALFERDSLDIVDVSEVEPDWLDRNAAGNKFEVFPEVGELTDALLLSDNGIFAEAPKRRAFAACIDQEAVAAASSAASGVDVGAVLWQSVEHEDPARQHLRDISDPHRAVNMDMARELDGATIRIGYRGQDQRLAKMVEKITELCRPAGIEVVDVAVPETTAEDLHRSDGPFTGATSAQGDNPEGVEALGNSVIDEGASSAGNAEDTADTAENISGQKIDAYLGAIYPPNLDVGATVHTDDVNALRDAEKRMWEQMHTIPLAAQPRVFVINRDVVNAVPYTGESAIGWNMDRWWISR